MKTQLATIAVITVLLVSITIANEAFAQKPAKNDIKSIMETYRKAILKAQSDFTATIKKANTDAREAVSKGLPIDQINADSKAAIQKARVDLKAAVDKARSDTKSSLAQIKAAIGTK